MPPRLFRQIAIVALLGAALAGCGFHLRGTQSEPLLIDSIAIDASNRLTDFSSMIENELRATGTAVTPRVDSETVLYVLDERVQSRPITSSGSGSASQYEVQLEIEFALQSGDDQIIGPTLLSSRRIYSFDRESLVGNSEEERLLTMQMRREIAQRLIQQINASMRARESSS